MKTNETIMKFMKETPELYKENEKPFWDDEHISKGMLAAHINPNIDAASRKLTFINSSVEWISGYANPNQKNYLLDLGCGPGIYADKLYDKGLIVTGVDFSKRSINYAKEKALEANKKIDYNYMNYLDINYDNKFDIITLIYCDFGVLSPKDRSILLDKIYRALKKGGIFILDAWGKTYLDKYKENDYISYSKHGFWSSEPHVAIERDIIYEETNNTLEEYMIMKDDSTDIYYTWNQIYTQESLQQEIEAHGLCLKDFFDDVCGSPFTGTSETICGVFKK